MSIATILAALSLAIWVYLLLARGGFWRAAERDPPVVPKLPDSSPPAVTAVIPARDEADVVGRAISSLLAQDFAGRLDVVLVDDQSSDGTAETARQAAAALGASERLTVLAGPAAARGLDRQALGAAAGHRSCAGPAGAGGFPAADRCRYRLCARDGDRAGGGGRGRGARPQFPHGQAHLRQSGRARPDPRLRLLLPDALSLRLGEPAGSAPSPRRPAAACWCGARRCSRAGRNRIDPRRAHRRLRAGPPAEGPGPDPA